MSKIKDRRTAFAIQKRILMGVYIFVGIAAGLGILAGVVRKLDYLIWTGGLVVLFTILNIWITKKS